ncbi:MAG: NAD(P)H-dependent oxidoreductase subunit E [Bacteroidota bacterium]
MFGELSKILDRYEAKREALIPCLHAAQRLERHISRETVDFLAREIGINKSEVYGVATFYHMFSTEPLGETTIRVCTSLPCHVRGKAQLLALLERELGISVGETTPDGKISLIADPCMGLCDIAPAMMINGVPYGNLTPEKTLAILEPIKQGAPARA